MDHLPLEIHIKPKGSRENQGIIAVQLWPKHITLGVRRKGRHSPFQVLDASAIEEEKVGAWVGKVAG